MRGVAAIVERRDKGARVRGEKLRDAGKSCLLKREVDHLFWKGLRQEHVKDPRPCAPVGLPFPCVPVPPAIS